MPKEGFSANEREIFRQIVERLSGCETYALRYYPINTADLQNDEDEGSFVATCFNAAFQAASYKIEGLASRVGFRITDVLAVLADESGDLSRS